MSITINTTYNKSLRVATVLGSGVTTLLPTPNSPASGLTTAVGSNTLVDSTKDFRALGIRVGDLVINTGTGSITSITGITPTTLGVADNYFNAASLGYAVYSQTDSGCVSAYRGAVLYNCLGTATGNITVTTLDGYALNVIIPAGGVCPLQVGAVTAVAGVTWGQLIALW